MARKSKQTSFSTIIVVHKDQQESRSVRIKTKHLERWRHYALSIAAVFAVLIGTVIYLVNRNNQAEAEKQRLLAQITHIKGQLPVPAAAAATPQVTEAGVAQGYIQSIQQKLKTINDYLRKRGLSQFAVKAALGDGKSSLSANQQYASYDEYLGRLVNSVAFTPMGYPRISAIRSIFGYRSDPFDGERAEYHPGIDFSGHKGDPVKATADGKVDFTGWNNGYGNCIIIKHKNNFETLYGHLSHIDVQRGQTIHTGDVIGRVGSTGHSTGPHLHYEVRVNGRPVNPANFLSLNR